MFILVQRFGSQTRQKSVPEGTCNRVSKVRRAIGRTCRIAGRFSAALQSPGWTMGSHPDEQIGTVDAVNQTTDVRGQYAVPTDYHLIYGYDAGHG